MGQVPAIELPDGLLELMAALEAEWPARRAALHASGVPLNDGEDDGGDGGSDDGGSGGGDDGGSGGDDGGSGGSDDGGDEKTYDAAYVKKLRDEAAKHRREAKDARAKVKEFEDKDKSEAQKLEERATAAEKQATETQTSLLRLEVALEKAPEGMSIAQVRKLAKRLTGSTKEELEADAEELFEEFTPAEGGDRESSSSTTRRPRERLRPGAAPSSEEEETDPAKLAAKVPRRY